MSQAHWISDIEFGLSRARIKKTGALVPYSPSILGHVFGWLRYHTSIAKAPREPGAPFKIAFTPDNASPWYLIHPVVTLAGGKIVSDPGAADIVFQFEDTSALEAPKVIPRPGAATINFGALDVRKSTVAAAFEEAFGYGLAVDPTVHVGPMVEKGEINGAHDGRIVVGPAEPRPGRVYQRLIDNRIAGREHLVEDIRTPTVGGEAGCVYLKRRPVDSRFANTNSEVVLARPEDLFSPEERERIADFCRLMKLEWGGLDVLRDRADGRIYIVDANKTDMGPPLALGFSDKMKSTRILAQRFRALMNAAGVGLRD